MSEGPFAPFVPAILAERLVRTGREVAGPDGWRTAGVVLVIDITGFTALTERLVERGPGGAETLASILNLSFGDVIERIHARGGDVVHFAGDAILAVWPRASEDLADAVVAAATCARGPASPSATCGSVSSAGSATNGAGSWADRRLVARPQRRRGHVPASLC
jgi:class 3 adenylate cyclase